MIRCWQVTFVGLVLTDEVEAIDSSLATVVSTVTAALPPTRALGNDGGEETNDTDHESRPWSLCSA